MRLKPGRDLGDASAEFSGLLDKAADVAANHRGLSVHLNAVQEVGGASCVAGEDRFFLGDLAGKKSAVRMAYSFVRLASRASMLLSSPPLVTHVPIRWDQERAPELTTWIITP
ncbi:hypothetical protein [Streptomyces californicus]|uniref:hypothetical protein n=1 Tax=Streptomyces californicus TaxID=67351 RepID=UPI0033F1137D